MEKALAQARDGRLFILGKMLGAIQRARDPSSPSYAPRVYKTKIIRSTRSARSSAPAARRSAASRKSTASRSTSRTTARSTSRAPIPRARSARWSIVERLGQRRRDRRGLPRQGDPHHQLRRLRRDPARARKASSGTSELAEYHVTRPEDVVSVGDEIMVRVIEIDSQGRVNLLARAVLEGTMTSAGSPPEHRAEGERFSGGDRGGAPMGERRPYDRPRPYGGGGGGSRPPYGDRGPRPGGPSGPPRGPRPPRPGFDR